MHRAIDLGANLASLSHSQPQPQLAIRTYVPIDKVLKHRGHRAPFKPEPAQHVLRHSVRDVFGAVGLGVEHDHAQRIAMLPSHQVGDGGFSPEAPHEKGAGSRSGHFNPAKFEDRYEAGYARQR
jgi:hypothetical protein